MPEDASWDKLISRLDNIQIETRKISTEDQLSRLPAGASVIIQNDDAILSDLPENGAFKMIKINRENFHTDEDYDKLINFLQNIHFRHNPEKGYDFLIQQPPTRKF